MSRIARINRGTNERKKKERQEEREERQSALMFPFLQAFTRFGSASSAAVPLTAENIAAMSTAQSMFLFLGILNSAFERTLTHSRLLQQTFSDRFLLMIDSQRLLFFQ